MSGAFAIGIVAALPGAGAQEAAAPIPYSAILEAPDDLDLNFRYARQQIAQGRLPGAASTLERILIQRPDWHQVRLVYGIVLYRLGQTVEARAELAAVERAALSERDAAMLDRFAALAERAERSVTGNVGVTAGFNFDTNRNNFPLRGLFQVDLPGSGVTIIESNADENADIGYYALVDGTVSFDTGLQRLSQVSIEGAGLVVNQVEEDQLDIVSGLAGVAAVYDAGFADIHPRLFYRRIGLGGDQYLSSGEARVRIERKIGNDDRLRVYARLLGGYEDFSGVEADPFASEADGAYFSAGLGAVYVPVDRLTLGLRYAYWNKEADQPFEAFDAHEVRLSGEYVLAPGVSVGAIANYTHQGFDAPDPFVSTTTAQKDDEVSVGLAAVISAGAVARAVGVEAPGAFADSLLLNLTGSYRHVDSNLPNYEYDNFRFGVSVTKRFYF